MCVCACVRAHVYMNIKGNVDETFERSVKFDLKTLQKSPFNKTLMLRINVFI
jgi:hypothetical protein